MQRRNKFLGAVFSFFQNLIHNYSSTQHDPPILQGMANAASSVRIVGPRDEIYFQHYKYLGTLSLATAL
ncbi:hypothetical protein ABKN59_001478 [Abortiporus biennis]